MLRHIAAILIALGGAGFAEEPVEVLLYGPSEEIRNQLDQLPRARIYKEIAYRPPASRHIWKLLVGISGGIDVSEVPAVLDAARFYWALGISGHPWKLLVRGNDRYSQVTMTDGGCGPPLRWYLFKSKGQWVLFDGVGTPVFVPPPCDIFIPEPAVQPASGPLLE